MDWALYIGVIGVLGIIRIQQKKLKLLPFLLECLLLCVAIYVLRFLGGIIAAHITFSLPQPLFNWIGGLIIFSVACYLSFRAWNVSDNSN